MDGVGFIRWNSAKQSDHYPEACWKCGTSLVGEDPPYRHQIVEIPHPLVAASISPVSLS